ncbi:MAG: hypothetical protein OES46_10645 [Gammaproteobacteria bacterium]|nr:hypothetical protein [Gammaproteobacteria bacterium]
MFNVGQTYRIRMIVGGDEQQMFKCQVIEVDGPVIKIRQGDDDEQIINTASSNFVSAEPEK